MQCYEFEFRSSIPYMSDALQASSRNPQWLRRARRRPRAWLGSRLDFWRLKTAA